MMDPKQKKIATVCCVGCVILGWRIYSIVTKYMPSQASASASAPVTDSSSPAVASNLPEWIEVPPQTRAAQEQAGKQDWGRDPFAPVPGQIQPVAKKAEVKSDTPTKVPPAIRFSGVSRSGDKWLAAINGSIYRVGDKLDDNFTIHTITSNSVTLACDGWSFEFSMGVQKPNIRRLGESP
jgi:hypothetical protein